MSCADPKLHLAEDGKHKENRREGQANSVTASHAKGGDDAVIASFSIVVEDGGGKSVITDVIVG